MMPIHCQHCGGFISDPTRISYRFRSNPAQLAIPHSGRCACLPPIAYASPPGNSWSPGMPFHGHRGTGGSFVPAPTGI